MMTVIGFVIFVLASVGLWWVVGFIGTRGVRARGGSCPTCGSARYAFLDEAPEGADREQV